MTTASFTVSVDEDSAQDFARLSGDWNPLHTDPEYAARTSYRRPVLHGAFAAGLMSRMAGMELPGTDCLLHSMRLRWVAPIVPPAQLLVVGELVREHAGVGRVDVTITDADSGTRYVTGGYEFGRHTTREEGGSAASPATPVAVDTATPVLVTGASGALGSAVMRRLGQRAVPVPGSSALTLTDMRDLERLTELLAGRKAAGIVHCAWPSPDNERLVALADVASAVEHNVAMPLRQVLGLARLIAEHGTADAMLCLIGSTAALPGRHNWRMPLYSLAKSTIPTLCRILATELGPSGRRCAGLVFDVLDGGMNSDLSPAARIAHEDRAPTGRLPTLDEAADQVAWLLDNASFLSSGATISLTGAAAP